MPTERAQNLLATPKLAVSLAGALAVVLGALVLVGWARDVPALKSVLPGWVSMKPNTALCFILTGIALLPLPLTQSPGLTSVISNLAHLCGLLAGLIGLLTLVESVFAWDFGIDQLLFTEPAGTVGTSVPGRMAPDTALSFMVLAATQAMLRDPRKTRSTLLPAAILCALVLISAASNLLTYFTPELGPFGWWGATIMAVPTAAMFATLAAAMLWQIWQEDVLRWSLSAAVTAGFALGLTLLMVVGLTSSRLQVVLQEANQQTLRGETTLKQFAAVEAEVASTQNHTRGYIITGDAQMLQSHALADANARDALAALRQNTADGVLAQMHFTEVEGRALEALQWFRQVIAARQTGPGVQPDQVRHGEALMRAFRAAIDQAQHTQGERLQQYKLESQTASRFAYAIISGGMVLSLLILASALLWLNYAETERRRTQTQLDIAQREKAAGLYARSLLEASLDPLVTISAQGKITDVNEASVKATGVAREALVGTDFADYFTDPDKAREGYQQVFAKGLVTDYQLSIRHSSGNITDVLYNASVYRDEEGQVLGVFAAARDITERKKAEDALKALSKALTRSNLELEQFAYVASHDLQEPLRMVVGYVQLLEKRLAGKLDADTREFMAYAVDGASRMQGMIQDILAYSRITTKAQPMTPVDSAAALQEALDRLAGRIKECGAEIDIQPLPTVMADRAQLVQLFQNLISNAIKFCKGHAPRVRVQAAHEAGRWRFSVTDNGIGIAPEYRDQLFVIFRRLHTQREYPGSGIGLAICKRIIERHGGEIGIDAAPGGGAVFWFTLTEEHGL